MIVAGIGSRKGVRVDEVLAAVDAALNAHGLGRGALGRLATLEIKREETGIFEAAVILGVEVVVAGSSEPSVGLLPLERSALPLTCLPASSPRERGEERAPSTLSLELAGVSSVSEAAALAAAGAGARLAGPRTAVGRVTCAIAYGDGQ